jgi:type IV pilus assembly protein PilB
VVKYVQKILLDAINGGASDIHFEPFEKFYRIRYRTDGILYDVAQPPLAIKDKLSRASRWSPSSTSRRSACPRTGA